LKIPHNMEMETTQDLRIFFEQGAFLNEG